MHIDQNDHIPWRIAIFGAGGVGGYFGGRLAQAGEEVILIARGEHLTVLRAHGLRVESPQGDFIIRPALATNDPARVGVVDVVLVGVKAWQVAEAAAAMRPLIGAETIVIPLQNGVDAPAQLAAILGASHVLGGLCRISAYLAGPGHIVHAGIDPFIAFGRLDNQPDPRAAQLLARFKHAQIKAAIPPDIRVALWEKFIFIATLAGAGAVTRAPAGMMRRIPETRQMMEDGIKEIVAVARAHKVNLPPDAIQSTWRIIDALPDETTASMQRDIVDGKPSELGTYSGAIVRMGLEAGIPTPVHAFIYASLLPQELAARGGEPG